MQARSPSHARSLTPGRGPSFSGPLGGGGGVARSRRAGCRSSSELRKSPHRMAGAARCPVATAALQVVPGCAGSPSPAPPQPVRTRQAPGAHVKSASSEFPVSCEVGPSSMSDADPGVESDSGCRHGRYAPVVPSRGSCSCARRSGVGGGCVLLVGVDGGVAGSFCLTERPLLPASSASPWWASVLRRFVGRSCVAASAAALSLLGVGVGYSASVSVSRRRCRCLGVGVGVSASVSVSSASVSVSSASVSVSARLPSLVSEESGDVEKRRPSSVLLSALASRSGGVLKSDSDWPLLSICMWPNSATSGGAGSSQPKGSSGSCLPASCHQRQSGSCTPGCCPWVAAAAAAACERCGSGGCRRPAALASLPAPRGCLGQLPPAALRLLPLPRATPGGGGSDPPRLRLWQAAVRGGGWAAQAAAFPPAAAQLPLGQLPPARPAACRALPWLSRPRRGRSRLLRLWQCGSTGGAVTAGPALRPLTSAASAGSSIIPVSCTCSCCCGCIWAAAEAAGRRRRRCWRWPAASSAPAVPVTAHAPISKRRRSAAGDAHGLAVSTTARLSSAATSLVASASSGIRRGPSAAVRLPSKAFPCLAVPRQLAGVSDAALGAQRHRRCCTAGFPPAVRWPSHLCFGRPLNGRRCGCQIGTLPGPARGICFGAWCRNDVTFRVHRFFSAPLVAQGAVSHIARSPRGIS